MKLYLAGTPDDADRSIFQSGEHHNGIDAYLRLRTRYAMEFRDFVVSHDAPGAEYDQVGIVRSVFNATWGILIVESTQDKVSPMQAVEKTAYMQEIISITAVPGPPVGVYAVLYSHENPHSSRVKNSE